MGQSSKARVAKCVAVNCRPDGRQEAETRHTPNYTLTPSLILHSLQYFVDRSRPLDGSRGRYRYASRFSSCSSSKTQIRTCPKHDLRQYKIPTLLVRPPLIKHVTTTIELRQTGKDMGAFSNYLSGSLLPDTTEAKNWDWNRTHMNQRHD